MRRFAQLRQLALLLLLASAPGCAAGRPTTGGTATAGSGAAPARVPARRIRRIPDANTVALLLTSHNGDVAAARLAAPRAQLRDVKLLARNMITDHATMATTLSRLATAADITPREDEVGRLLRDASAARRDTLRALRGWAFDSAYVETELGFHRDLLVAIDEVFLPSARNASLREYIATIRPTIARHLALAEQMWSEIGSRR